jgi:hypothetical protein
MMQAGRMIRAWFTARIIGKKTNDLKRNLQNSFQFSVFSFQFSVFSFQFCSRISSLRIVRQATGLIATTLNTKLKTEN